MTTRGTVAKLLLVNDANQALVLRIGVHKRKPERSHQPDLPGGMVDPGESERDAAVRELFEETGIAVNPADATLAYTETAFYEAEDASITKLLYVALAAGTPSVTLSGEHESFEWCDVSQLLEKYQLRPFYAEAVEYVLRHDLLRR